MRNAGMPETDTSRDPDPQAREELAQLHAQLQYLRGEISSIYNLGAIAGTGRAHHRILEEVRRVAGADATVLINGEAGTGKELIARAIHAAGRGSGNPFVKVSDADLRQDLLNERFALARHGTIYLEEIGQLDPDSQARLLRVLHEQEISRAGAGQIAVRVIAATRHELRKAVRAGEFREDLYYRVNVFPVEVPPLRARPEDIPPLVEFFARKYGARVGRRIDSVDPDTLADLTRYSWPGNIRELENLVERAAIIDTSSVLKIPAGMLAVHAPAERAEIAAAATGLHRLMTPRNAAQADIEDSENTGLHHVQREHILRVLNATRWVIEGTSGAALKLGMKPATLRHRMKKLGIARTQGSQAPHGP